MTITENSVKQKGFISLEFGDFWKNEVIPFNGYLTLPAIQFKMLTKF